MRCLLVGTAYDLVRPRFPSIIRIETTNACNARCTICPHPTMTRQVARMDEGLFRRIVDECARRRARQLHLHNFGEPLLDNHLEDRIRYAKSRGIRNVRIFTNGSLISEPRARGLIGAGLDAVKISFDGADKEEFERIRHPLRFDEVVDNTRRLIDLRNELRSPMKIKITCCSTSDKSATMRMLEELADGFSFARIHNWATGDQARPGTSVRKPCDRLWRTVTILPTGDLSLCCLDYDGRQIIGRVDERTTIRDLWNSQVYRRVRRQHKAARQASMPLCASCVKSFVTPWSQRDD